MDLESQGDYTQDQYGRKINPNLLYEYENDEKYDITDEQLIYGKEMYEDELEEAFFQYLNNSKLTPKCKSTLMTYYQIASSKDIVLGNYTYAQAKRDILILKLNMKVERMKLKGEDALSRFTGQWDTQSQLIIQITTQKYIRGIDGFERKMQRTVKNIAINEEIQTVEHRNK